MNQSRLWCARDGTATTVEAYFEPSDTAGMRNGAVLFSCDACGTEWDVPMPS